MSEFNKIGEGCSEKDFVFNIIQCTGCFLILARNITFLNDLRYYVEEKVIYICITN